MAKEPPESLKVNNRLARGQRKLNRDDAGNR
jgi:hypothetical protein